MVLDAVSTTLSQQLLCVAHQISEWTDRNGIKQKNLRVVATEIKRVLPSGQSSAPEPSMREVTDNVQSHTIYGPLRWF